LDDAIDLPLGSDGDFHPDRLLASLPPLRALVSLGEAASEGSAFERLLGGSPAGRAPSPGARGIDAFSREVVGKHLVPVTSPRPGERARAGGGAGGERGGDGGAAADRAPGRRLPAAGGNVGGGAPTGAPPRGRRERAAPRDRRKPRRDRRRRDTRRRGRRPAR